MRKELIDSVTRDHVRRAVADLSRFPARPKVRRAAKPKRK